MQQSQTVPRRSQVQPVMMAPGAGYYPQLQQQPMQYQPQNQIQYQPQPQYVQPGVIQMQSMGMQQQPQQYHYVQQQPQPPPQQQSGNPDNEVFNALGGSSMAIIPRIGDFPKPCGCCRDPLRAVLGIHIVRSYPPDTQRQVIQLSHQVKNMVDKGQKTPLSSDLTPETCLCQATPKRMLDDQEFKDVNDKSVFSLKRPTCCFCFAWKGVHAYSGSGESWGTLEERGPGCCVMCKAACCLLCCRSAGREEYAYLVAVDAAGEERLTFRHPKQEGKCLFCSGSGRRAQGKSISICDIISAIICGPCRVVRAVCCPPDLPPDEPFNDAVTLYGPMGDPAAIGHIEWRGAKGYDRVCHCGSVYGIRPELMASVVLSPTLSTQDAALAALMALDKLKGANLHWNEFFKAYQTLPWLDPAEGPSQQRMK